MNLPQQIMCLDNWLMFGYSVDLSYFYSAMAMHFSVRTGVRWIGITGLISRQILSHSISNVVFVILKCLKQSLSLKWFPGLSHTIPFPNIRHLPSIRRLHEVCDRVSSAHSETQVIYYIAKKEPRWLCQLQWLPIVLIQMLFAHLRQIIFYLIKKNMRINYDANTFTE